MKTRLCLVLAALCSSCVTTPVVLADAKPIHLTIVGTNDVHGWVATQHEKFASGDLRYGGVAAFAGYLRIMRAQNPDGVVLLDAGDLFQGTLLSNLSEGAVVVDAYNALGYDAVAVGNHEFDYGPVGPQSLVQPGLDPVGALKARIAQARFPFLAANITEAATGQRPAWLPATGTVMITRQGLKIGLIGLTTPLTPKTTLPANVATLKFAPLTSEALAAAKRLRAEGADLVIATVHGGGRCSDNEHPLDLSTCDLNGAEIFELAKALPAGTLDGVVAGHTHAYVAHIVNGLPIVESGAQGHSFGTIELTIDPVTKKVLPALTEVHTGLDICETVDATTKSCDAKKLREHASEVTPVAAVFRGQPVVADAAIAAILEPGERKVAELQNRALGLTVPTAMGRNYDEESALGSFLADSLRGLSHADVAMLNSGGLRADLKPGELHYGDLYEVLPFDNTVATVEVTGEELLRLLRSAYSGKKGLFQESGLEVKVARCPKSNQLASVTVNGKPIDEKRTYRMVMPDYLARGGGGFGSMIESLDPSHVDLGEGRDSNVRDELVTWWQSQKTAMVAPKPGRITFVNDCTP